MSSVSSSSSSSSSSAAAAHSSHRHATEELEEGTSRYRKRTRRFVTAEAASNSEDETETENRVAQAADSNLNDSSVKSASADQNHAKPLNHERITNVSSHSTSAAASAAASQSQSSATSERVSQLTYHTNRSSAADDSAAGDTASVSKLSADATNALLPPPASTQSQSIYHATSVPASTTQQQTPANATSVQLDNYAIQIDKYITYMYQKLFKSDKMPTVDNCSAEEWYYSCCSIAFFLLNGTKNTLHTIKQLLNQLGSKPQTSLAFWNKLKALETLELSVPKLHPMKNKISPNQLKIWLYQNKDLYVRCCSASPDVNQQTTAGQLSLTAAPTSISSSSSSSSSAAAAAAGPLPHTALLAPTPIASSSSSSSSSSAAAAAAAAPTAPSISLRQDPDTYLKSVLAQEKDPTKPESPENERRYIAYMTAHIEKTIIEYMTANPKDTYLTCTPLIWYMTCVHKAFATLNKNDRPLAMENFKKEMNYKAETNIGLINDKSAIFICTNYRINYIKCLLSKFEREFAAMNLYYEKPKIWYG